MANLDPLELDEAEMAVLADALNLHRMHLEGSLDGGSYIGPSDWLSVQGSLERKLVDAGLIGSIDGLRPTR